ncbi:MAG: hypothetical protein WAM71_19850 [Candidatus Korobacteraceae bacterium]
MPSRRRKLRDSGHLLLAVLLMMALMVIAATYEAPRVVQQLKRDREEEMIHRGTEYARAIKKYYKKMGSYPSTIEQLENTNNIRFLRKRYKDPLTKDGKWTLLHYNDVINTLATTGGPGIPAAGLASQGQQGLGTPAGQQGSSTFGSSFAPSGSPTSGGFGTSTFGSSNTQPGNQAGSFAPGQPASSSGQQGTTDSSAGSFAPQSTGGDTGSSSTGSSLFGNTSGAATSSGGTAGPNGSTAALGAQQGLGGQTFGAGAIMGVASKSKDPTIRVYNKKKTYNEWQFIYNPVMDQANVLLKGPYSPSTLTSSNIGTPAGQLNQQNQQQSPFGQQGSGFGSQQPGGFNNNQQTLTPGGQQFPPDQSH